MSWYVALSRTNVLNLHGLLRKCVSYIIFHGCSLGVITKHSIVSVPDPNQPSTDPCIILEAIHVLDKNGLGTRLAFYGHILVLIATKLIMWEVFDKEDGGTKLP